MLIMSNYYINIARYMSLPHFVGSDTEAQGGKVNGSFSDT